MACRSFFATIALAGLFAADAACAQDFLLKYPDIVGQWRRPSGIGIQWDQTKPIGRAQQPRRHVAGVKAVACTYGIGDLHGYG